MKMDENYTIRGLKIEGFLRVSPKIIEGVNRKSDSLFCFKVKGNSPSMSEGDYAVVDGEKESFVQGALLAVILEGTAVIIVRCVECSANRVVLVQESNRRPIFIQRSDAEEIRKWMVLGTVDKVIPYPKFPS